MVDDSIAFYSFFFLLQFSSFGFLLDIFFPFYQKLLFSHLIGLPICIFFEVFLIETLFWFLWHTVFIKSLNFCVFVCRICVHMCVWRCVNTRVCRGVPLCLCGGQRFTFRSHFAPPALLEQGPSCFCCSAACSCPAVPWTSGGLSFLPPHHAVGGPALQMCAITCTFKKY